MPSLHLILTKEENPPWVRTTADLVSPIWDLIKVHSQTTVSLCGSPLGSLDYKACLSGCLKGTIEPEKISQVGDQELIYSMANISMSSYLLHSVAFFEKPTEG